MKLLTFVSLLLTGCAAFDGGWRVSDPNFRAAAFEWNHVQGPNAQERLHNLCGGYVPHLYACTFRIRQSGYCVTFSRYSEEAAKAVRTRMGVTLLEDERRHCGVFDGVNIGGAYEHD
jgi:hypothetical protein